MNNIDKLFEELDKKPETLKEKVKDCWYDVKYLYETYIRDTYLGIKNYIRNLIRYSPILWNDYDWDYDFFLNIQERKLKFMEKYHRNSEICVENPWIASRIKLALSLLEVARSVDADKHEESFWTPYVNTRNARRFHDRWESLLKMTDGKPDGKQMSLYDLRIRKAWFLYHKLLFLYSKGWWD